MTNVEARCQRAGCGGVIVEGFCDTCGRPPAGQKALDALNTASGRTGSSALPSQSRASASVSFSGRAGSGRSSKASGRGRVSTRRQLGAGLVSLPLLPSQDPLLSIMPDPVVPDRKRYCNNCNTKLNHEKGFCPNCGQEYSFVPTLQAGDVVAGQFEVKGAIAFGGLGWIYLGWDTTLSRWVVLKGLLNSKDAASAAAAVAERQFLAAVKNPKIVGIYNFVTRGAEGYIVMEYVGGKTLKALRQERGPLPVAEAIAYTHAILPAFAYLERQNLVYCDFKPDNIMLEDDDVKLIDMGGVRRIDDTDGDVYGTVGYTAPEADQNPSFTSDLYTVGRTLAVLLMDFKFQGTYLSSLPTPAEQPIFARYDSLYRFLLRATHNDPDMRFQSADEMAEQLLGVLREVMAESGVTRSFESPLFTGDTLLDRSEAEGAAIGPYWRALPMLKLDALDTAAPLLLSSGSLTGKARVAALESAAKKFPDSVEAPLRLADEAIAAEQFPVAENYLAHVLEQDPFDWRVWWYRGRLLLAQGKPHDAQTAFDKVYSELPGELAPKLAIGLAAELAQDWKTAIGYYDRVSRTEPNYVSAAFGLARCLGATADKSGAVAAYARVPATSSFYTEAQMSLARALLQTQPSAPGENELAQAAKAIAALSLEGFALHRLSAELFLTAVAQVEAKAVPANSANQLLGQTMAVRSLRASAERELRACARYAKTQQERFAFVDQANSIRPRTLL